MGYSSEDELREVMGQMAKDLAETYSNPSSWGTWLVFLFERLEAQAAVSPSGKEAFRDLLSYVQESIRNRVRTGGW
jgi:hypothetical protein